MEFSVTTNGSLLTEKILDFFNRHKFVMLLSFDGLAQEKGRKRGTLDQMVRVMKKIQGNARRDFHYVSGGQGLFL